MTHRQLTVFVALLPALACMGRVKAGDGPDPGGPPAGGGTGGGAGKPMAMGGSGGTSSPPANAPPSSSAIPECKGDEVPGPRRLRLLTRAEYANSVADLLGLPVPTVDNLP